MFTFFPSFSSSSFFLLLLSLSLSLSLSVCISSFSSLLSSSFLFFCFFWCPIMADVNFLQVRNRFLLFSPRFLHFMITIKFNHNFIIIIMHNNHYY